LALIDMVGVTRAFSSARLSRQNPTRIPYSYQVQFGISGIGVWPIGGCESCRAIGRVISHSSTFTTVQTIMRPLPGSRREGRQNGDE
jgi:hypothetical protein